MTRSPADAYETIEPGPAECTTAPLPHNKPAPITPPIEIIVMWRILRSFFRFLSKSCTSPSKLNFETYVSSTVRKILSYTLKYIKIF